MSASMRRAWASSYWVKAEWCGVGSVAFGVSEIHGLAGFGFFGIVNLFLTWIVCAKLARVDLEEAGFVGQSELQGHGMAPSVVSFVFWWMLAHTLTHHA